MTEDEEKALDRENIDGMRDVMDTLYYIQHELKEDLDPDVARQVREYMQLYFSVYGHDKKTA